MLALDQNTISPFDEMLAYEALWGEINMTEKKVAELFKKFPGLLPHEVLFQYVNRNPEKYNQKVTTVRKFIVSRIKDFSVSVYGDYQYPERLRDAKYPIEIFYYIGDLTLTETRCISIVGSRNVSEEGAKRARKLAKLLVKEGYTIVSGLAKGVDCNAQRSCIENGGRTIGVIGTPIDRYYPKENRELQDEIKKKHLLISQVPFYRYTKQNYRYNRIFFPQRNATMAALSEATVIVEAGESSGTLTQARACMNQGRKLFILNNLFERNDLRWPRKYEAAGAIRVKDINDIIANLSESTR